jgi:hypothetical protein
LPFDWRTFRTLFREAFRDPMSPRRRAVVWCAFLAIPFLAAINALCFGLDRLLFPGLRAVPVREPVFIIGHARSGTSLMHRLLACDSGFAWFRMYELFLPSLLQKRLVRALGSADRRWLGGGIERRVRAWEDRTFAKGREMHPMSLTGPEEDEFLMTLSCASGTVTLLFPYMRQLAHLYYFDERPTQERRRLMRFYRECVQRQLHLVGGDRRLLSKNPVFCGRVESLIEWFPDARFIVMVRDPCQTIPSLLKMMKRNWRASDCPADRVADSLDVLAQQSIHTYRYPLEVLERHRSVRHAVVRYEDLVASPKATVERVYSELALPFGSELSRSLDEEETRSHGPRADHVYGLEEFGLERQRIRSQLADLFERFGWAAEVPET